MNATKLSRHYPSLAPAERLSLLLAAAGRNDDVEHTRIASSAKWVQIRVPDTAGRAAALLAVLGFHRMEQLELAAIYLASRGIYGTLGEQSPPHLDDTGRLYGYLVQVHAAGQRLFLERINHDGAFINSTFPGKLALKLAADLAEEEGTLTTDEARALTVKIGKPVTGVQTAEGVADALCGLHEMMVARWARSPSTV